MEKVFSRSRLAAMAAAFCVFSGNMKGTEVNVMLPGAEVIPVPVQRQIKWHEAEMGVVFHYDLHVFDGKKYGQGTNRTEPVEDYNIFNPEHLDTDQWIRAAKAAGAKFAILTATHETGFGLWQSDVNPYCLKAVKWRDGKGDIIRDFVNSCRKYGLQPGIYVGIRWNSLLGIHNFKAEGDGDFARNRQEWYRRYCERMVEELCTRYGPLFMIWFDGGADDPAGMGPDVEPIVEKYQPDCLFYHNVNRADLRWGGSESGTVGYPCWSTFPYPYSHNKNNESAAAHNELLAHGDPDGKYWVPAMADTPLRGWNGRHEWFWEPGDEETVYPLEHLMEIYDKSVGRNATLIVGLTPDPEGLIPEGDVKRLEEWGIEIEKQYGSPLAETSGAGNRFMLNLKDGKSNNAGKSAESDVEQNSLSGDIGKNGRTVDCCIIQEDISKGERIRSWRVEAKTDGGWNVVCSGTSVGHKHIAHFPAVGVSAVRLIVDESVAEPQIRSFRVFGN